jgi:hypothetical protein
MSSPPPSSKQCPNCSQNISADFAYCPVCGDSASVGSSQTSSNEINPSGVLRHSGISISRNGQVFGPYPRDVVEKWIASGQLQKHDLGCSDVPEGWQPLGKLLWPEAFASAGSFSGKQWAWIVVAIVGFVGLAALASNLDSQRGLTSTSPQSQNQQPMKALTDFERGEQYFDSGSYLAASDAFEKVGKDNPKYADAQSKLKIVKQKIAEQEQKEKKKVAFKKQYEKLCHSHLYLFQIEERLQRENFHMDQSGFETAPDGSTGVRQYFSKTTSDGFVIKMWLQNAYSMSAYYCEVEVD